MAATSKSPQAALNSLRQEVVVNWPKASEKNARALLVAASKEGHRKIMERAKLVGAEPTWTAFGDTPGTPPENARRTIVYKYTYINDIVRVILNALQEASPVDSGLYKRSHQLYINGFPVPIETPIRKGEEVMIANPLPYARRLEVGKTESGRDFLISKPNHIYERVRTRMVNRYKSMAKLDFTYVTMPNAHIILGRLSSHYGIGGGRRRKRKQEVGKEVRAPAIIIRIL